MNQYEPNAGRDRALLKTPLQQPPLPLPVEAVFLRPGGLLLNVTVQLFLSSPSHLLRFSKKTELRVSRDLPTAELGKYGAVLHWIASYEFFAQDS